MKKLQRMTLALILILVLIPVIATHLAVAFETSAPNLNTASAWAQEEIQEAYNKGFIPIDLQDNYTSVITREEFCRLAINWMECEMVKSIDEIVNERGITDRMGHTFSDTTDPIILAAYRLGVTNGTRTPTATTPGVFNPSGLFDRQQAATMLMNVCRALGANVDNPPLSDYADMNDAAIWALDGINFVRANGIMTGTRSEPPTFTPLSNFTRQESIITFGRIEQNEMVFNPANGYDYVDGDDFYDRPPVNEDYL